jgi:hypothetical protein
MSHLPREVSADGAEHKRADIILGVAIDVV